MNAKNMKMVTKLCISFIVVDFLLVLSLFLGYRTAQTIVTVDDPVSYLSSFATFTAIEFIAMQISIGGIVSVVVINIKKSMADLMKAADDLAQGKVDLKMKKRGNDEFGALIDSFQKVIDNTKANAQVAQEVANGNMMVEVTPKSDEDVMGLALQKMVAQTQHSLGNIKDAAYKVTANSSQVAAASEALAQGSTEQASAIEQITASIADVAEKTRENANQANAAAQLVAQAIEDVKKGNVEMQEMVVAMEEINKASESISKIIKVIDDIAFQTNILSLNAAVEAARAGDAGKGFAVVAEEVRNLAAKSSSAAAETAEMIEDSIRKVEAGSKIANGTAQALGEITTAVAKSERMITDIAEASNYQAAAISQIDQAIAQVSQVVQNNSATSEECAAASMEMSAQASRVRDMLAIYKLKGMDSDGGSDQQEYDFIADKNEQIISLNDSFGKY